MESKNRWPREFYASDAEAEEMYNKDGQLPAEMAAEEDSEAILAEPYYGDDYEDVSYSAADDDESDDIVDNDDDDDAEEEADRGSDWGNVDPQSGGFPTGNEPTAPGSAV